MWGFIVQEPQENKIQILSTSSKPFYSKIMQKGMVCDKNWNTNTTH
jgi:hypothetical protein